MSASKGLFFATLVLGSLASPSAGSAKPKRGDSDYNTTAGHEHLVKRASGVTWNPWDAAYQEFDYIVVGGGLTGIAVASRLSENPGTTVLIVEAGRDDRWDPRVLSLSNYGQVFGSDLDWSWGTDHGRGITGGKTLGGSSSINGAAWTRGLDAQYDAWGQLLETSESNLNWNWANIFGYMKKAETWSPPNDAQRVKGADSIDSYHGFSGPVQTTFTENMYGGPQQPSFVSAVQSLTGIAKCRDLNGGKPNCVAYTPNNINWHDNGYRSTSAAAYLTPVESSRTNWVTLVNHQVLKLLWADGAAPKWAYGIEFKQTDNSGQVYQAYARKEVILAAGAINTPALLQLSGVGDPAKLNPLGIPTVINLPTVGKNLQEQTMSSLGAGGNGFALGGSGPANVIAYPNIYEVYGNKAQAAVQDILGNLASWAQAQAANGFSASALETIFRIQADLIVNKNAPIIEMFSETGYPDAIGISMWNLLPFSRGTVQITSNDPFQKPQIKVNPFSVDRDMLTQVEGTRLVRKMFRTQPMSGLTTGETTPGTWNVADDANGGTESAWRTWIWDNFNTVSHPVGTCAMMRRNLGGVVDGRLRVYDTVNVRVVDASIMPTQISAHMSSTLYAIAEKVADMIKNNV